MEKVHPLKNRVQPLRDFWSLNFAPIFHVAISQQPSTSDVSAGDEVERWLTRKPVGFELHLMNLLPQSLGLRIQKMRLRQHRTLEAVARECGFTKSLLSKIERGRTTPPVATLMKIASTLGVTVTDLLSVNRAASTDFTAAANLADSKLTRTEKGYLFHLFAGGRSEKLMQPFLFVARKGEIKLGPLSHRGEEFIYVLSGEMTFRVGHMDYRLRAGDSLYFDSEQMHDLQPTSDKVTYLAVFADTHVKPSPAPRRESKVTRKKTGNTT